MPSCLYTCAPLTPELLSSTEMHALLLIIWIMPSTRCIHLLLSPQEVKPGASPIWEGPPFALEAPRSRVHETPTMHKALRVPANPSRHATNVRVAFGLWLDLVWNASLGKASHVCKTRSCYCVLCGAPQHRAL